MRHRRIDIVLVEAHRNHDEVLSDPLGVLLRQCAQLLVNPTVQFPTGDALGNGRLGSLLNAGNETRPAAFGAVVRPSTPDSSAGCGVAAALLGPTVDIAAGSDCVPAITFWPPTQSTSPVPNEAASVIAGE